MQAGPKSCLFALCLACVIGNVAAQTSAKSTASVTTTTTTAAAARPDFSGVYRTVGPIVKAQDLPVLTPEYEAKHQAIARLQQRGEYRAETGDPDLLCLPPGLTRMMNMPYGMEIMQTADKITFFSEWLDVYRRVYLDGRKPTAEILDDPTYNGYSTGYWEGDTLVIDTVALKGDMHTVRIGYLNSDALTVHERLRFTAPGLLENRITLTDPLAFTKPVEMLRTYRRAEKGKDELREFACTEGLGRTR